MRKLFGTDGIRGRANIYPMTCETALALGRAVTFYFQEEKVKTKPTIVIGKDTRLSCYMLEQAFAAGVCSQGGKAIFTGPLPTPGVAFVTKSMRADVGVMISASHNVYSDNGIKIFDRDGHKLPDDVELKLEELIANPEMLDTRTGDMLGSAQRLDEVVGRYNVQVKSAFPSKYSLDGMRIIIDCANGAGYKIAPMVFRELGAEVIELGVSPNGTNINQGCGALHPESCAEAVVKFRADVGICLDGDGDRLVVIDDQGDVVHGDHLLGICARYLEEVGELGDTHEVVGTIMSNLGLENYLKKQGINFYRTTVGDRYIVSRMRESGAVFGGEPSGHIIFKNYSTTGDGILAALKVIECYKYFGAPLREMASRIILYPQVLKNVAVKNKIPFEESPAIMSYVENAEKKLGDKGRILLRYSGTEPKARVMVEGEDEAQVNRLCDDLVDLIRKEFA